MTYFYLSLHFGIVFFLKNKHDEQTQKCIDLEYLI